MQILLAAVANERSVEEVARVELHARFGRPNLHQPSGVRFIYRHRLAQSAGFAIEHEVVVIAAAVLDLLIVCADARADRRRLAEVKRRSLDRRKLARRNESLVHRRVSPSIDLDAVIQNVTRVLTAKIEVGVIRDVVNRSRIRLDRIVDAQGVLRCDGVLHRNREFARITLFSIWADQLKGERRVLVRRLREHRPNSLVKPLLAAVEVILAVVDRELIVLAVE